eukprot:CAMPEP_0194255226 /NCGR_PEP_ID=MMETSP0158-20130606/33857_1 /TAXON_ID=33649 /ORGANISM="Thalassionema nitzschioides, Strain L26-B" /LENGTH=810 /DNA_ID=CAMNT_0038993511 /DNA_START=54 /DNA_END=2486 /DNA_ORIENTATION=-
MKRQPFLALVISLFLGLVSSKVPDAEIYINGNLYRGSYGNFGSRASFEGLSLQEPPSDDPRLCSDNSTSTSYTSNDIVLVPRGTCSFESKMLRAHGLGAVGVIIYNNLESRYSGNDTDVIYPSKQLDYECANGQARIQNPPFNFDPPAYNGTTMNSYMEMDSETTRCQFSSDDVCDSRRCLFTAQPSERIYTACCAWDIHVTMSWDSELKAVDTSHMVAIFVTMEQSEQLVPLLLDPSNTADIQARPYPRLNASSFLLWMLGTFVVGFASWYSAKEYRSTNSHLSNPTNAASRGELELPNRRAAAPVTEVRVEEEDARQNGNEDTNLPLEDTITVENTNTTMTAVEEIANSSSNSNLSALECNSLPSQQVDPLEPVMPAVESSADPEAPSRIPDEVSELSSSELQPSDNYHAAQPQATPTRTRSSAAQSDSLTLGMWHAFFFVLFASLMLLLLFFFQFYTAITILYGIGCAGSIATLIFQPIYSRLPSCGGKFNLQTCLRTVLCPRVTTCGFHEIVLLDVLAALSAYTLCILWLVVWFTSNNPSIHPYYWIMQDVMGACISILFLSLFRLNSIKVATVLLAAVFVYDIFFVFLTPYLFNGESVMITVAQGGGPPEVSEDYCEKYPDDSQCRQGQPLPMLLSIPRIGDFRGGSSLLGLGDIVLPGLLISFAARLDEAKRLVGDHTNMRVGPSPRGGYLLWLIVAYAIGLFFANLAVVLMRRGQPALLYIVPAILSAIAITGWNEFRELWKGPRVFTWADRLVYYSHTGRLVMGDEATVAESDEENESLEPVGHTATMVRAMNDNDSTQEFT